MEYPKVSIGIVRGRTNNKWFNTAYRSAKNQVYLNDIDIIIIENQDRKKTIGKCFNEIAMKSKGDWIMYLGDDDFIVPEYILSLITRLFEINKQHKDKTVVNLISHITQFNTKIKKYVTETPTGMWLKEYVLLHPFDEKLLKYVDTEMFNRLELSNKYFPAVASHQFGYYYRQHNDNVSGNKLEPQTYVFNKNTVLENNYYVEQNKNYALGNFVAITPTIMKIYKMTEKKVPVFFETEYVKNCYLESKYIDIIDKPIGEKILSSAYLHNRPIPDHEVVFNLVFEEEYTNEFPAFIDEVDFDKEKDYIVIINGSGNRNNPEYTNNKCISEEIIQLIIDNSKYKIIFTGNSDDYIANKDVLIKNKIKCYIDNIRESLGIIRKAKMVICNDTGFGHCSGALKTKTVVLWKDSQFTGNVNPETIHLQKNEWNKVIPILEEL